MVLSDMLINRRYHCVNKSTGFSEVSGTFSEQLEHRSSGDFCQSAGHSREWPVQGDLALPGEQLYIAT